MTVDHVMADELPDLVIEWEAAQVPDPRLVVLNESLATELGLDPAVLESADGIGVLSGNLVPEGARPVALAYAGHQFGNYSPLLGDGRALLLGEITAVDGTRYDIHLKGSGRTPFARGGDGKATLGPMLREYLISEYLHRVGAPTTRSLAVVTTGERIWRDGAEPGAVLTRTAASHIRVGTFELAVRARGSDLVRRLADHAIGRHFPEAMAASNPYEEFLRSVVDSQALLISKWMTLGFIHGVMNTDNMTVSGEGIDYGPCAFMDAYDPATVFSSIDHGGRYAYGNQVRIAMWNLARLAETMLTLLDDDVDRAAATATEVVNGFADRFRTYWTAEMTRKLGLDPAIGSTDRTDAARRADDATVNRLADDLLTVMAADRLDWTLTFRELATRLRGRPASEASSDHVDPSRSTAENRSGEPVPPGAPLVVSEALDRWTLDWFETVDRGGVETTTAADLMDSINPVHIPRNHLVDEALASATHGDLTGFHELASALERPFDTDGPDDRFAEPASSEFTATYRTFCGT